MKISNNALNFLLAQYRAIFKRAYVKGIASAVLLTAGLAAGQAQAHETALNNPNLLPDSGTTITITSTGSTTDNNQYKNINIESGSYDKFDGELIISGGTAGTSANNNYITGNQETKISGKGTLTINVAQASSSSDGLEIAGNGGNVSIDISAINVQNGLLNLKDKTVGSGSLSIGADTITIGNGNGNAVVTLTGSSDKGLTLGRSAEDGVASTITVNKGGVLILNDASTDTGDHYAFGINGFSH